MALSVDRSGDDEEGGGTTLADINVTPLVDVMLVLLVIFMVTTPLIHAQTGVKVNLPTAKTGTAVPQQSESAVITVRSDGIWIDDRHFTKAEFDSKFEAVISARAPKEVFLRADKDVPYGEVIQVMDQLRSAGITKLGMMTSATETASNK